MAGTTGIIKPGLERISLLLKYLGNPQTSFFSIQVAGTNGKGSTAHFLNNILIHSGVTVGLYTSPHILSPEERITVLNRLYEGNLCVDLRKLEKSFLSAHSKMVKDRPTFFELLTAIALDYFREKRVDFAILETGLGGKLDATTAVGSIGEILTDISLDHPEYLGNSLEEILHEKLGIVKGKFFISCSLPQYLGKLVEMVCRKRRSKARFLGKDFFYEKIRDGIFTFISNNASIKNINKTSLGEFQYRNATLSIAAALKVCEFLSIDKRKQMSGIRNGVYETIVPGRFQQVSRDPDVIIDVGHNVLSAQVIKDELEQMKIGGTGKVVCVFTMMSNRNPVPFLNKLREVTDLFVFFPRGGRYLKEKDIERLKVINMFPLRVVADFPSAFKIARHTSGANGLIILTGSFAVAENYYLMR